MEPRCQEIIPKFNEIKPDSSKISEDLREIQKTVQNYGNWLYGVPQQVQRISLQQEETLKIIGEILKKVERLEQGAASSSKRRPINFGKVTYPPKTKEDPEKEKVDPILQKLRQVKE